MSEKRKQALVAYLAGLFGVAFLIVSISLVIELRNGSDPANSNTAAKVTALQEQIQALTAENQQLQSTVDELSNTILEIQEGAEFLEGNAYNATSEIELLNKKVLAYYYLAEAQRAYMNEDKAALKDPTSKLTTLYQYLEERDQDSYFLILEHMEQVYFGVDKE